MIIECPACESRYRIREDKLPQDGGNIKCPNCAHVFFVASRDEALGSQSSPAIQAAPPAPPVAAEDAESTPAASQVKWKLRNEIGLVLEFQTTDQLRAWLTARETLEGLAASRDGGATFKDVGEFDELADVEATGRKTVMGMAAIAGPPPTPRTPQVSGSQPVTEESMREAAQARLRVARKQRESEQERARDAEFRIVRAPENERDAKTSRMLGLMAVIILPLFLVAALNVAGVIDLGAVLADMMPEEELDTTPPPQPAMPVPTAQSDRIDTTTTEPEDMSDRARSAWYADRAATRLDQGDTPAAIGFLEQAAALAPEDTVLQCQLADLYGQVGNEQASARAQELCEGTDDVPAPAPEAPEAPAEAPAPDGAEPAPTEPAAPAEAPPQ